MAELIWKGKYDKDGKRAALFQVARLINRANGEVMC